MKTYYKILIEVPAHSGVVWTKLTGPRDGLPLGWRVSDMMLSVKEGVEAVIGVYTLGRADGCEVERVHERVQRIIDKATREAAKKKKGGSNADNHH